MSHDATKILMGTTQSSMRDIDNRAGSIAAGKIVRLKSDGTLSVAAADGAPIGISLGRSLSDTARTAICRSGLRVPVQLEDGFTPTIGAVVSIDDTTGLAGTGTAVNAVYVTGVMTGVGEDGVDVNVALIDFPGGL